MPSEFPFYLAGQWGRSSRPLPVVHPYDGATCATTWLAGDAEFERAAGAAVDAAPVMRALPAFERAAILRRAAAEIHRRRDEFARTLALEAGKPIRDAGAEIDRGAMTFEVAAEEARRIAGEVVPMDLAPHGRGRFAVTRRFPLGPVAAISPFNFPFNLSAHKVAPAIAAGDPIVLKPASRTPLSALALAMVLDQAGLPSGALSVLPMDRVTGDRLVTDDRFK
ncbi:MAG: aldehyde dehydrogenase family protein, partial [Acidobacteria bacterium]|nr:aldehyde dehydrogenase family protein [Acidobacteriota bacterium]